MSILVRAMVVLEYIINTVKRIRRYHIHIRISSDRLIEIQVE